MRNDIYAGKLFQALSASHAIPLAILRGTSEKWFPLLYSKNALSGPRCSAISLSLTSTFLSMGFLAKPSLSPIERYT